MHGIHPDTLSDAKMTLTLVFMIFMCLLAACARNPRPKLATMVSRRNQQIRLSMITLQVISVLQQE
jgi:hypothetical protein